MLRFAYPPNPNPARGRKEVRIRPRRRRSGRPGRRPRAGADERRAVCRSHLRRGANFGPVGGAAAPGDYLVIVVQGPAQVQADLAAGIQAGSLVCLGSNGVTTAANGPAIGMVLDVVGPDGLVWVLVGFH